MAITDTIKHGVAVLLFERPARKKSIQELIETLNESWQKIDTRVGSAADAEKNQKVLRHVIGIERWGQSRLRTLLGDSLQQDEYDGYQPAVGLTLVEQRQLFRETRAETVDIAKQFVEKGIDAGSKAFHNDFGKITIRAWLRYLDFHAAQEARKIK